MNCTTPHHAKCMDVNGKPKCLNGGHCYPCIKDRTNKYGTLLCTSDEKKRGFRCICPLGFLPPFCHDIVSPCSFNKCQNGATCISKTATHADYEYVHILNEFFTLMF